RTRPRLSGRICCQDGRGGDQRVAGNGEGGGTLDRTAQAHARRNLAAEKTQVFETAEGGDKLPEVGQSSGVDDSRRHPGDSTRAAAPGATRWRTFCYFGSQRSLSSRYQSQQPSEEVDGVARAGRDCPQRKAHASGSG